MLSVGEEELRVDLLLVKHHKDGRVADVVDAAVVQYESSVDGRREAVVRLPSRVAAHEDAAHKHGALAVGRGVVVGVARIPGKVAPCTSSQK